MLAVSCLRTYSADMPKELDPRLRRHCALESFFDESMEILKDPPLSHDLDQLIKEELATGKVLYSRIRRQMRAGKIFYESSNQKPIQRFVVQSAVKAFLEERNLLEQFYEATPYCPIPFVDIHNDQSDADIWCIEFELPKRSMVRLNYKYAPGVAGEGWEAALIAIHKRYENQWLMTPQEAADFAFAFDPEGVS